MKPEDDDLSALPRAELSVSGPTLSEPAIAARRARDDAPPGFPSQPRDRRRYDFLGEHGRGGIGRVSRAHDRDLGRDVAIKELLARGGGHEARFLREVLITARLEHPGIVPVHEAGRWPDGTPFYAMKLVSGRPLRELLAERKTVEARLALLHHVIAVADAIAYAHGRQIIHRDLKPSNIIVGEFGETVVIDSGLAKDLTSAEEPTTGEGPFRASHASDHELTMAGAVLGTPAYMSPEQKYGEQVDQRTDVFAIGTMLWELCAIQKIPPDDPRVRHRMLRDAGIDNDFATIINKALDAEPELRYPDAGALAADLKAFKAGARIAARSYSLLAMLAHWTRHHRTMAMSAGAALAIALIGSFVFVRHIAAERDRADASERVAEDARASAETSLDQLTLNHAQLLLTADPSAAVEALATYHGADAARAAQIRAEAVGRGVATLRAQPHTNNVMWTEGMADGTVLSLGTDSAIVRTARDAGSTVVARGVSRSTLWAYAPSRRLLAYACNPLDVCLFDAERAAPIPGSAVLRGASAIAMAFSPDGSLLAMASQDGELTILDMSRPAAPAVRLARKAAGAVDVEFIAADTVVAGSRAGVQYVHLDGSVEPLAFPGLARWGVNAAEHELALATAAGQVVVFDGIPGHVAARAEVCHGPTVGLRILPAQRIAYACRDGALGIWDLQRGKVTPRAQLQGHADLITSSPEGDYIVASGGNGTLTVLDLHTDLVSSYAGHRFRLTSITPPTRDRPFLISGDVHGAVREWRLPGRLARVVATSSEEFHTAIFDRTTGTITATTWLPALTVFPAVGSPTTPPAPHEPNNLFLEQSRSGHTFVAWGLTDLVEVWAPATATQPPVRLRVLETGHGSVSQLRFTRGSEDFITAGHDGRVVRWTADGDRRAIAQLPQSVDKLVETATGDVVLSTADGALWRIVDGKVVALRAGGSRAIQLIAGPGIPAATGAPGPQTVYAGFASGDVIAFDTGTWQPRAALHAAGAVQELTMTADGQRVVVATNDGTLHVGTPRALTTEAGGMAWDTLGVRTNHLTVAPDGLIVATGTDGMIWLYASALRALCVPTGPADFGRPAVSADGTTAAVGDREGRLLSIDLSEARKLLDVQAGTHNP